MSLPSWERGLKRVDTSLRAMCRVVAPLVGAWIETSEKTYHFEFLESLPSWERGLKQGYKVQRLSVEVAPLVGAWIET